MTESHPLEAEPRTGLERPVEWLWMAGIVLVIAGVVVLLLGNEAGNHMWLSGDGARAEAMLPYTIGGWVAIGAGILAGIAQLVVMQLRPRG